MNSFKKTKSLISALTGAALLFSLPMTAGAESNINYTGMFLGYDGSVNTSPVWTYNPDIVSYDLLNWNQGGTDAASITSNSASAIQALGKIVTVSTHMPNPQGGNVNAPMSDSDFEILANTDISSINSSSPAWLQNYKAQVDNVVNGLQKFNSSPVYYRPFHEMNGGWFWWGNKNTTDYKNLYINLYNYIVTTNGMSNVNFVYAPNKGANAAAYYPGSSYVTWIGIDAYSDDPSNDNEIKMAYNDIKGLGKTYGFCEIGPAVGGDHVDRNNNQLKEFDYSLWNKALNEIYTGASFFITWDGAYAPQNNINGSTLFTKESSQ
ncbi:Mannan endo-1,4-beta-mannosidase precursor [compost metagenome]